jgi:hypothetical protein
VLDDAGWHGPEGLDIPDGIGLTFLPPYSPELQSLLPYRTPNWCGFGLRGWWRCEEGRDSLGAILPR